MYLLYNGLASYNEQRKKKEFEMKMRMKLFVIDPKVDDLTVYKWLRYIYINIYIKRLNRLMLQYYLKIYGKW